MEPAKETSKSMQDNKSELNNSQIVRQSILTGES